MDKETKKKLREAGWTEEEIVELEAKEKRKRRAEYDYYVVDENVVKLFKEEDSEPFRSVIIDALLAEIGYYYSCKTKKGGRKECR